MTCPTMAAFALGAVVALPIWPRGQVEGKIQEITIKKGRVTWRGLVVVAADGSCWEFRPELARPTNPRETP